MKSEMQNENLIIMKEHRTKEIRRLGIKGKIERSTVLNKIIFSKFLYTAY